MGDTGQRLRQGLIPALIASGLLLIAIAPLPYGYYVFLRLAICGLGIFMAYMSYRGNVKWLMWVFIAVAVLFNPLIPIHLTREIWKPIDVICTIIFLCSVIPRKDKIFMSLVVSGLTFMCIFLTVGILFGFASPRSSPPPLPTPAPLPAPAPVPASGGVTNLIISPLVAQSDEVVTITAEVTNTGGTLGEYLATLEIDGVRKSQQSIYVYPRSCSYVTFQVKGGRGVYSISVGGLSATYRVLDPIIPN